MVWRNSLQVMGLSHWVPTEDNGHALDSWFPQQPAAVGRRWGMPHCLTASWIWLHPLPSFQPTHLPPGRSPSPSAPLAFRASLLRLPGNSEEAFSTGTRSHPGSAAVLLTKVGAHTSGLRFGKTFPTHFAPCSDQREPPGSHRGTLCREVWGGMCRGCQESDRHLSLSFSTRPSLTGAVT